MKSVPMITEHKHGHKRWWGWGSAPQGRAQVPWQAAQEPWVRRLLLAERQPLKVSASPSLGRLMLGMEVDPVTLV